MDENQALLGKDFGTGKKDRTRPYTYQDEYSDEAHGSSSDDSEEWWDDSHSSCGSSCCSNDSGSSFTWEGEVNVNGELFYIESDVFPEATSTPVEDEQESAVKDAATKATTTENEKKGKLAQWMRRRDSKRQRPKATVSENPPQRARTGANLPRKAPPPCENVDGVKEVIVKLDNPCEGESLAEKVLGITTRHLLEEQRVIVTGFVFDAPVAKSKQINVGDTLRSINEEEVTPQNLDKILRNIKLPSEVVVHVEARPESESSEAGTKAKSNLVRRLIEKDKVLETVLEDQPIGLVFLHLDNQTADKKDVIYSFPSKSSLAASRGSFSTLYHLLSEILSSNHCLSSTVIIKKQLSHVIYKSEDKCLLLITVPDSRCTAKEATNIVNDLLRCLLFNHQSLYRCFTNVETDDLNHFFSVFFSRILTNGFSLDFPRSVVIENISALSAEPPASQFEDILPFVAWIPLPREAQIQIDDAMNELEANDFDYEGDDNIENQRLYNIIGSCFYHKGYLLASHLPKDDLLDVHAFCRQNCIVQLMRTESVKSLIIWREVYPSSTNRGLAVSSKTNGYTLPTGRWFLLIVGQGFDLLAVLLESGGCCVRAEGNPGPSVEYIEEAEDTLRHVQKLGISGLASQWLRDNVSSRTVSPEDIFYNKTNRKKENLLSFVKTLEGNPRAHGSTTPPNGSRMVSDGSSPKNRVAQPGENSEDNVSQAPSNVSEISDENAPILGRRAERVKNALSGQGSDTENSDSDWESFKDSNRHDLSSSTGGSSGILRGFFSDISDIMPSKLTTGSENVLFHYVQLDGNEGIFMCPTVESKSISSKMREILDRFRKSAMLIHTLLENNVRFKKNSQGNAKCLINKSLIAVKEHGVLLECAAPEQDANKRANFSYWVVGRLFFTPQPREVYVCYYDEAPQNLVEIAFRLGLNAAG